ncbi:hypothetical protein [Micropruina sonneratiae]|uniref:hypothetical protein n=1 Tax=Micropruina sonneratiae TaxID=2986940 RepID=UPI00222712F8|nr:hypothetical protein [Micropruina sp. KQZ13P-5]MCW3159006.1 hypothetical protein [Micropruina sp. KQZ13P-5]
MILADLLVLIGAFAVAGMLLAPLESLHWWATRGIEEVELGPAPSSLELAASRPDDGGPRKFVVYLSGIGAIGAQDVPQEEVPFIADLRDRLSGYRVIDDVFPYAVDNRSLTGERLLGWLWRQLEQARLKNPNTLLATLINIRNLMQLFVCADRRYGPTYNMGMAKEIHRSLVRHGHAPGSPDEVVLLGWSGGGQIALGAIWYLHAMGLRCSLLSLGGMLSDDIALARTEHLWHLYGSKDFLQASGQVLFAGRWPISKASPWNEALRDDKITFIDLGPYNHNVKQHYFDYESTLPDGRTYAGKVVDTIAEVLGPRD